MFIPSPWNSGDPLSASHLDESRQSIAQIVQMLAGNDGQPGNRGLRPRLAIVSATDDEGNDDEYTDCRHWVTLGDALSSDNEDGSLGLNTPASDEDRNAATTTAVNMADKGGVDGKGTHFLRPGTVVLVFPFWGARFKVGEDQNQQLGWVFSHPRPDALLVDLESDGGSANPVSYTYTATWPGEDTEVGTELVPLWRPIAGNVPAPATAGLIDYGGEGGTPRLLMAFETLGNGTC